MSLWECVTGDNPYWKSGDNILGEATPRCCRKRLRLGLEHLAKIHLVAVAASPVEPLPPSTAIRSAAALLVLGFGIGLTNYGKGFIAVMSAQLKSVRHRGNTNLTAFLHRPHRTVLRVAASAPAVLLSAALLHHWRALWEGKFQRLLQTHVFGHVIRFLLRISSHFVCSAAASLPVGKGLIVGGGDAAGNDGMVDLMSQYGLDAVQRRASRLSRNMMRTAQSFNTRSVALQPAAMMRAYSGTDLVVDAKTDARPLEKGKWRVLRIPGADHSLGTCMSKHSMPTYDLVFRLLRQVQGPLNVL